MFLCVQTEFPLEEGDREPVQPVDLDGSADNILPLTWFRNQSENFHSQRPFEAFSVAYSGVI